MSFSRARASRIASSCPKDFDFQFFIFQDEGDYMMFYGTRRLLNWLNELPEQGSWNGVIAILWMVCTILVAIDFKSGVAFFGLSYVEIIDLIFNIFFGIHLIAIIYYDTLKIVHEEIKFNWIRVVGYLLDACSYFHYLVDNPKYDYTIKLSCYWSRTHRPFRFLWDLHDYNLKGSVLATALKYLYIFSVMRLACSFLVVWTDFIDINHQYNNPPEWLQNQRAAVMFRAFFVVHKNFLGLGLDFNPHNNEQRVVSIILRTIGTLTFSGISITWLALVMGMYMRNGELFRMRVRLLVRDMEETHIPMILKEKVRVYYRMYWHKQKAISSAALLRNLPPTLTNSVYTDIYFEAQQKSRILRDLSFQFLSETAKVMQTINYVPGDIILQRNTPKDTIYFIKYGDVEVLTAEDDETPILRFTRGTIINPCGGCMEVAGSRAHVSVRAATFCTAHVLHARDLWHVAARFGKLNGQSFILHSSFEEHFEKVKKHYKGRTKLSVRYKSSILLLKRNLIDLKLARDLNGKLIIGRSDKFIEIAGCYTMRNRADTSLYEETDDICLRSTFPCILQPTSSLQIAWQCVVGLFVFIIAFRYPYQMTFLHTVPDGFRFFNYMMTILFIFDLFAHLSTGDNIEEGVPVTFTQTSSEQAKSPWFVINLLSAAPIFEFIGQGHYSGLNKLIKIPAIFKLLKNLDSLWSQQHYIVRSITFILFMIILNYLMATVIQALLCFGVHRCLVTNFTNGEYWKLNTEVNDDDPFDEILMSVFCSVSLMVFTGNGDHTLKPNAPKEPNFIILLVDPADVVLPGNADVRHFVFPGDRLANINAIYSQSQIVAMCMIEMSTVLRIIIDSTFSATIIVTSTLSDNYATLLTTVQQFFTKNNVAPILKHRFINYLDLCWYVDKAYSLAYDQSIWYDLPEHVHKDILMLQRMKYLQCVRITRYASKEEMKIISAKAHLFYSSPNEILLNTGDLSNEVYVIRQGYCDLIDPVTKEVVKVLSSKDYFGEMECILKIPAYYTVKATTHVQVFALTRKNIQKVLNLPKVSSAIRHTRIQPICKRLMQKQLPFIKYEIPDPAPSLQRFPLLRKHEPDVAFLHPFQRLGFFSILRYVFPRFTIRPDGKYLRRYEFFRMCCALLSALIFPIYTWIMLQWPNLSYVALFLDFTAYFDVLQRMLIGYFNEKGILVFHPASTAANYVKGAFITDLLSCLPIETLDTLRADIYIKDGAYLQLDHLQQLRYNRLFQLYRVPNAIEIVFRDYVGRDDIMLIIKGIPMFMTLTMVITSLLMGESADRYQPINVGKNGGWRIESVPDPLHGDWVTMYHKVCVWYNITSSPWNFFLSIYYWTVNETTSTGFGLFSATSRSQLIFLTVSMFLGNLMTTYFSVRIISIRSNVNKALAAFQEQMRDLVIYMQKENLDKELQKEAIAYYNYNWDKTGGMDYRKVLKLCAQISLRTDAIVNIYGTTFSRCPILKRCELSLIRLLGRGVYSMYFSEGMTIIENDDIIGELYFIDFGTVEVYNEDECFITKLPRGSVFGNLNKNTTNALITNKITTTANVHLLKIHTVTFFSIIQDFHKVQELIDKHRPHQENYIIGSVGQSQRVITTWKERAFSSAIIKVSSTGVVKYLNTHGKGLQIYLIIISLMCIYLDLYNAAFRNNSMTMIGLLYTLDFAFLVKMIMNWVVPYFTEEETEQRTVLVANRKKYFQEEFKFDIFSILPIEALAFITKDTDWKLFALLRLNRILRVTTVKNSLKRYYEKLNINLTITTVIMVLIWFSIFIHTMACIWYMLGTYADSIKPKSSWRYDKSGNVICDTEYFCAFYFVILTFMQNGVGDIMPRSQTEVAFTITLMISATMIYMIYVGEFSNVIQFQAFRMFSYYSEKIQCEEFMIHSRVAPTLKTLVKKYLLYIWREQRGLQMPEFLVDAPHCLRLRIMNSAYGYHLANHELFANCEPAFLRLLSGCLQLYTYMEGMYIVKEGEVTDAMYFIHKGSVKELSEDFEEVLRDFEAGNHFGTVNGLTHNLGFQYSYKTLTKAQVLTLNLNKWEFLLEHFPESKEHIFKKPDKDYDTYKVKEKKKVALKTPRVLFQGEQEEKTIEEDFLGIPSGRSDSDLRLPKQKTEEAGGGSIPLATIPAKDSEPKDVSWPLFSRYSIAAGDERIAKFRFATDDDDDDEDEEDEKKEEEKKELKDEMKKDDKKEDNQMEKTSAEMTLPSSTDKKDKSKPTEEKSSTLKVQLLQTEKHEPPLIQLKKETEEYEEPPPPSLPTGTGRKSTEVDVDKISTLKELQDIKSDQKISDQSEPSKPADTEIIPKQYPPPVSGQSSKSEIELSTIHYIDETSKTSTVSKKSVDDNKISEKRPSIQIIKEASISPRTSTDISRKYSKEKVPSAEISKKEVPSPKEKQMSEESLKSTHLVVSREKVPSTEISTKADSLPKEPSKQMSKESVKSVQSVESSKKIPSTETSKVKDILPKISSKQMSKESVKSGQSVLQGKKVPSADTAKGTDTSPNSPLRQVSEESIKLIKPVISDENIPTAGTSKATDTISKKLTREISVESVKSAQSVMSSEKVKGAGTSKDEDNLSKAVSEESVLGAIIEETLSKIGSEESLKSDKSAVSVIYEDEFVEENLKRTRSFLQKFKDQFGQPTATKDEEMFREELTTSSALLQSIEPSQAETAPEPESKTERQSMPQVTSEVRMKAPSTKKSIEFGISDHVETFDIPTAEEAESEALHMHSDTELHKMLSYAQDKTLKGGVEDFMSKKQRQLSYDPEMGSTTSLATIGSMASLASLASIGTTASEFSVEGYMMKGKSALSGGGKKKKHRVSIADQDDSTTSLAMPSQSGSATSVEHSAVTPPSWMMTPMNFDVLDHRILSQLEKNRKK